MRLSLAELIQVEANQLHKERETTEPDPDMWRWSPLEIPEFVRMLEVARNIALATAGLRRLTFLEAGSGIGTKLYIAQYHFGMNAIGYEIDDHYIELAGDLDVNTVKCDLREEDPAWDDGDIVYIARPFKDDDYESKWEWSVLNSMRSGTVLMSAYAAVKPYKWPCYYRMPYRGVWVKPADWDKVVISGGQDVALENVMEMVETTAPDYVDMIRRETAGPDPLVPQPLNIRSR